MCQRLLEKFEVNNKKDSFAVVGHRQYGYNVDVLVTNVEMYFKKIPRYDDNSSFFILF